MEAASAAGVASAVPLVSPGSSASSKPLATPGALPGAKRKGEKSVSAAVGSEDAEGGPLGGEEPSSAVYASGARAGEGPADGARQAGQRQAVEDGRAETEGKTAYGVEGGRGAVDVGDSGKGVNEGRETFWGWNVESGEESFWGIPEAQWEE